MIELLAKYLFILSLMFSANQAFAHAMAPSSLKIESNSNQNASITWKQPIQQVQGVRLTLDIHGCDVVGETKSNLNGDSFVQSYRLQCPDGIDSLEIGIAGLNDSNTYVVVEYLDIENQYTKILDANQIVFKFREIKRDQLDLLQFLLKGIEHLLLGYDHVLFVIGLLYLLKNQLRKLAVAITFFTLGHAISLGMTANSVVLLNSLFIETLILVSLIWLALEVLSPNQSFRFGVKEKPYLLTLLFGLVHGFGFANVLTAYLTNRADIWQKVFAFNVGVEVGQLFVVLIVLPVMMLFDKRANLNHFGSVVGYSMGGISSYWLLTLHLNQ